MAFVSGELVDGHRLRCLSSVDDFARECLAIAVDTSLPGTWVVPVIEGFAELRRLPSYIMIDNGREFAKALGEWA